MKCFVRENRHQVKALMAALFGGAVMIVGNTVTELAYLPLLAFIAFETVRQKLRRPRRKRS